MKDSVEVQLPSRDLVLVALRMKKSRDCISCSPFHGLPLNLCHSSAIEGLLTGGLKCTAMV